MVMRTVDSNDAYDKDNFVNAMEDLGELEKVMQILPKDPWHNEARATLGGLTRDDSGFYGGLAPDIVRSDLDAEHETYRDNVQEYSKKYFTDLLNVLDAEALASVVRTVPLVNVGVDSLDKIVDAVDETRKIEGAVKNRERGGIENYIIERVRGTNREVSFAYGRYNSDYVQRVMQAYARQAEMDLQKVTTNEVEETIEGKKVKARKLDKGKLYELTKASYEKVKSDEGEDSDEVKAYHLRVAGAAYDVLKVEED